MIETEELSKSFNSVTAVENLTMHVDKGEIFGLLGPNGAGKSTTVRMLCCLIGKTSGKARIGGLEISDPDDAVTIRRSIGYIPDTPGLYESMSAVKNLEFFGSLYRIPGETLKSNIERYLRLLDLWDVREKDVSTYSKGMKQKVSVARALVHEPEILIMDEPTANLDPEVSKTIRDLIKDLKKDNRTILINTHNLDEAQRICDRIGVLRTRLLAMDTPANLEREMHGRKTLITLDFLDDGISKAIKTLDPEQIAVNGNTIELELKSPEKERPEIISAIVSAGGRIQFVTESGSTLEEVYLKLVREA